MSPKKVKIFRDRLAAALVIELVCSELLPADYRRDYFRREMRRADNATAEFICERVMGRLGDDDPLSVLLGWT